MPAGLLHLEGMRTLASYPHLVGQWHPTKNGMLVASAVSAGSHKKVWWRCTKGADHEWPAAVRDRTKGGGCPFCTGKRASVTNSLATRNPEVAAQWHPTKNGNSTPHDLTRGSQQKVWWRCIQGPDHEWQATVANRTKGRGCPCCKGKRVSVTNSLAMCSPELAAQWHPTKNTNLSPADVTTGSSKKVWWKCPAGPDHEWMTTPAVRKYAGCPFCSGLRVTQESSLLVRSPQLAKQWHPTKNAPLTPAHVAVRSSTKVWWQCSLETEHSWEATPDARSRGTGCPYCGGQRASTTNSLAACAPSIAAQWHPTKNGSLEADQVTTGSSKRVWWKCPVAADHEWEAPVSSRKTNSCPFCSGRRISSTSTLAACWPVVSAQWHPTQNGTLTSNDVVAGSTRRVWWQCEQDPEHVWEAPVFRRTVQRRGCPYCAGQKVSTNNSLAVVEPKLAAEWHLEKNADLTPQEVAPHSNKLVWWKCERGADHQWQAPVANRTSVHQRRGCPYCAGYKVSTTNSLATVAPRLAAEWHPTMNGDLNPSKVTAGTPRKVWWVCAMGPDHTWRASIASRTGGTGCPYCAGQRVSVTNSLEVVAPEAAALWHPTRNEGLTPADVVAGSNTRAWWLCTEGPDHEWQAAVSLVSRSRRCPYCSGRRVSVTNSLASIYPQVAIQWHRTKNGPLRPSAVHAGTGRKVWWKCRQGPDHEWEQSVRERTHEGRSCPFCQGRRVSDTNCLATLFPNIAKQWHPKRNGKTTPGDTLAASDEAAWWKCPLGHVWRASVRDRTMKGRGCARCAVHLQSGRGVELRR